MSNLTVLLVEDTLLLAEMIMEALKQIPEISTDHCSDGDKAVVYLNEKKPDLILLDLNLPGRSGWQVLEFVKEKYGEGAIKVVVMTAQSDSANRLVGMLQHVERYMIKPVAPRKILSVVRSSLNIETPQ